MATSNDTTLPSQPKRGPGRPRKDQSTNPANGTVTKTSNVPSSSIAASANLSATKSSAGSKKAAGAPSDTDQLHSSLADIEARLSSQISKIVSSSLAPLKALVSSQQSVLNCKIENLEARFDSLCEEIDSIISQKLDQALKLLQPADSPMPTSSSEPITQAPSHQSESTTTNRHTDYERKFNTIVYGVPENPNGTPWATRASKDLNTISSIISNIENTITTNSIRDCYRLGKYSETSKRPRPVLVKLHRSHDAQIILSKRSSLKGSSVFIKPDMSHAERATEQILLKQCWLLIQSDSTNNIKIRGSCLFVNGRPHGLVVESKYLTYPLLSDHVTPVLNASTSKNNSSINTDTTTVPSNSQTPAPSLTSDDSN